MDRRAVIDVEALSAWDFELSGVEAELMEDGRVDVGDVVAVLDGVEAEFVGRAVDDSSLDASAGEPGAEALRVVIATVGLCPG